MGCMGHKDRVMPPAIGRAWSTSTWTNMVAGLAPPHVSFAKLARRHGPIMTLWLGSMSTVVISSNEVAREMFKNHDMVLAGRKIYEAMKGDFGHGGSLITSQYGPHWRMLRRLCTTEFLVTSRLDAMRGVRRRCIDQMLQSVQDAGANCKKPIDVGRFVFLMAFNLIGNLMFSKDLLDHKSEKCAKFFFHAGKVMELAGKPNVAGKRNDFLDVLLEFRGDDLEEPSKFSSRTINVIVFEMFTAGTGTRTIDWAMAELLHNPRTLKTVQAELRNHLGYHGRSLEEKDIENLPYLKAIIKETLRLHPPLPFLVPHMAMDSCKM
ncbi:hypothetical protein J1N35_024224 [Gossypium stocksii]|uniref:Cytochrome P450 n=1 Tax=Gossypium stocksii TaxID=47602 RepID=A0A9D3VK13_9ROSI|nr:hypothetical protein J1N35_024224 [Gossypium stocksii]